MTNLAALAAPPVKPSKGIGWRAVVSYNLLWIGAFLSYRLYHSIRMTRSEYPEKLARWERQARRWNSIFYCPKCDSVFDPGTHEHVPVTAIKGFWDR